MKTTLHISGARLAENFRAVGSVAGEDAVVLAVVKADAYGHGAALCAPVLVEAGAEWLGVGDIEEGAVVRRALTRQAGRYDSGKHDTRILVMCGMEPGDADAMVAHRLTPVVWTAEHVDALERAASTTGGRVAVHLKIDSGMARQGAQPGEALAATLSRLVGSPRVHCEGVLTHLACAEDAGSDVTRRQTERFTAGIAQVYASGLRPEWLHIANSSAVDEASTTGWLRELARGQGARSMVRTGLALYGHCLPLSARESAGLQPGSETPDPGHPATSQADSVLAPRLQPVLHWVTSVIGLREIAAGESVGYGATWTAARSTRLALLPVGYADGLRRGASSGVGNGWVMIAGQRAPVVGRVSMNLTTVDVTDIGGVREGAEVTLLGPGVSPEDHARWNGTITYEVLCGLRGHRVLR